MKNILKTNFKTSLAGLITGLPILLTGLIENDWAKVAEGAGIILMGFFAKDFNKTGTPQTSGK